MVGDIPITECREKYLAQTKEMCNDINLVSRGTLCFDGEKKFIDANEDALLDDEEDTKASLQ